MPARLASLHHRTLGWVPYPAIDQSSVADVQATAPTKPRGPRALITVPTINFYYFEIFSVLPPAAFITSPLGTSPGTCPHLADCL